MSRRPVRRYGGRVAAEGAARVLIFNRTKARAEQLASEYGSGFEAIDYPNPNP